MGYYLGVDVGTTFTAAAVLAEGRAEMMSLGTRSTAVPTVVHIDAEGEPLVGEPARRRSRSEPSRVAREFKRRLGDTVPIFVGPTPRSAESLLGVVLRWVADRAVDLQGGPPDHTVVTHPANWGPYRRELLGQALRLADLRGATTVTEPEAAAAYYASGARLSNGDVVAVYDLGGGTFDAALLRHDRDGFELLGEPEGVEHLGGVDVDEAVFEHVREVLGGAVEAVDADDPAGLRALQRLREDCTEAKEALSFDARTTIPVLLPAGSHEVVLTRAELEDMIRPLVADTIGALRRAFDSAGVRPEEARAVLLVGGSSRIPLVAQMVTAELGRPVAVDAHPKHAVALGAALLAGARARTGAGAGGGAGPAPAPAPDVVPPRPIRPMVAAPAAPPPLPPAAPPQGPPRAGGQPPGRPPAEVPVGAVEARPAGRPGRARWPLVAAAALLAVLVVALGVALSAGGDGGGASADGTPGTEPGPTASSAPTTSAPGTSSAPPAPPPTVPPPVARWQVGPFDNGISGQPVVVGNRAYGATYQMLSFDLVNGAVSTSAAERNTSTPAVAAGGRFFAGDDDGGVLVFDEGLALVGELPTAGPVHGPLAVADGVVFVASGDAAGTVQGFDVATLAPAWGPYQVGEPANFGVAVASGTLVVPGEDGVHAVRLADPSRPVWRLTKLSATTVPVIAGDAVYLLSFERELVAVGLLDGIERFRATLDEVAFGPATVADGFAYVGTETGVLHALALAGRDGSSSSGGHPGDWRFETGGPIAAAALVVGGVVYAGSADGTLYAIGGQDGQLRWSFDVGNPVATSPAYCAAPCPPGTTAGALLLVGAETSFHALDLPPG